MKLLRECRYPIAIFLGAAVCSFMVFACLWIGKVCYIYDYPTQGAITHFLNWSSYCMIGLMVILFGFILWFLVKKRWLSAVVVLVMLVTSLSLLMSNIKDAGRNTSATLKEPIVIAKDMKNHTITVQAIYPEEPVVLQVTIAEAQLFQVGQSYPTMSYHYFNGNNTFGYLNYLFIPNTTDLS